MYFFTRLGYTECLSSLDGIKEEMRGLLKWRKKIAHKWKAIAIHIDLCNVKRISYALLAFAEDHQLKWFHSFSSGSYCWCWLDCNSFCDLFYFSIVYLLGTYNFLFMFINIGHQSPIFVSKFRTKRGKVTGNYWMNQTHSCQVIQFAIWGIANRGIEFLNSPPEYWLNSPCLFSLWNTL